MRQPDAGFSSRTNYGVGVIVLLLLAAGIMMILRFIL